MKEIRLTKGQVALVDDEDYDWLTQWKWHAHQRHDKKFVAQAKINGQCVNMHRVILNTPEGMQTDHIDLNTLNNQRSNLRTCSNTQNSMNRGKRTGGKSQYKGVSARPHGRWDAYIHMNGKRVRLGTFLNETDAAKAYDDAAKEHHGEYARTNF